MSYTETVLPARVAELMEQTETSQRALADALGLSQQAVSRSLLGHRRFSVADLCKLAEYFNVSPGELVAGPDVLFTKGL